MPSLLEQTRSHGLAEPLQGFAVHYSRDWTRLAGKGYRPDSCENML